MSRGIFETLLGAVVLVVAIGFGGKLYFANDHTAISTYALNMRFNNAQGLKTGSDIRLGGVLIGRVTDVSLDEITLEALVNIEINSDVQLPTDSTAEIASAGLLGNNFLKITAGSADERLAEGAEITSTTDPLSLEDLLGRAIFALSEK